jgi:hypothetical protein
VVVPLRGRDLARDDGRARGVPVFDDLEEVAALLALRRREAPVVDSCGGPRNDDFGLDAMDAQESRDAHEIIIERHLAGSMILTSNRGAHEWLATFADPVRAQAAIDRFSSNPTTSSSRASRTAPGSSPGMGLIRFRGQVD